MNKPKNVDWSKVKSVEIKYRKGKIHIYDIKDISHIKWDQAVKITLVVDYYKYGRDSRGDVCQTDRIKIRIKGK